MVCLIVSGAVFLLSLVLLIICIGLDLNYTANVCMTFVMISFVVALFSFLVLTGNDPSKTKTTVYGNPIVHVADVGYISKVGDEVILNKDYSFISNVDVTNACLVKVTWFNHFGSERYSYYKIVKRE